MHYGHCEVDIARIPLVTRIYLISFLVLDLLLSKCPCYNPAPSLEPPFSKADCQNMDGATGLDSDA